jgi:hypothetical protein
MIRVEETTAHRTPGRSWARPPRTSTTLCSCRLCPSPGMYAWRTFPEVSRTRATLRFAEFGFLGFAVNTCITMPFRCGLVSRRGALDRAFFGGCLRRIAWLSVRSAGAEEWNFLAAAVVDVVEEHGWNAGNAGNAARKSKCVRDGAGRAMRLRKENMGVSSMDCRARRRRW